MLRLTFRRGIARVIIFAVVTAATACGPESVGKGAPPVQTASTPQGSGRRDTIRVKTATDTAPSDTTPPPSTAVPATVTPTTSTSSTAAAAATKTPLPTLPASLHRTSHDSVSYASAIRAGMRRSDAGEWPVRGPAPLAGAILPEHRIVAFYGNPFSKKMGVLGEYPVEEMLTRLDQEVARWREADPSTPVQPALHLIAVVAQGYPGKD